MLTRVLMDSLIRAYYLSLKYLFEETSKYLFPTARSRLINFNRLKQKYPKFHIQQFYFELEGLNSDQIRGQN